RHSYEERRAALTGETTWVYADICYLKRINDTHGHAAGDIAIAETARSFLVKLVSGFRLVPVSTSSAFRMLIAAK
ncbi:MAG: hypothetical protein AAF959_18660, partial [Cyanobacteria bacterium P01_D01_bin.56]